MIYQKLLIIESSEVEANEISKLKGVSAKYEKIDNGFKYTLTVDYDDLDEKELKKYENTIYGRKSIKLQDFKNTYLSDFACKEK